MKIIAKSFVAILMFSVLFAVSSSEFELENLPEEKKEELLAMAIERLDRHSGLRIAEEIIDLLLKIDSENPAVHVEHARLIMKTSGASRAVEDSARVAWRPGVMDKTSAALDRAIALDPDRADTLVLYGYVEMQKGNFERAISLFDRAEQRGTDNPWLYVNWGDTLFEMAKKTDDPALEAKSISMLEKAMVRKPPHKSTNDTAASSIVAYHIKRKDLEAAEQTYKKQLEFTGNPARANFDYSRFLLTQLADADRAIEHARVAYEGGYNRGASREILAHALCLKASKLLIEEGNRKAATPLFEEAEELWGDITRFASAAVRNPKQRVMLRGLSEHGADIFANEKNRTIPIIHLSVMTRDFSLVRHMIELGADPDLYTEDHGTPLHTAMFNGTIEIIQYLLEQGADPTVKYRNEETPLDIAERSHRERRAELVELITRSIDAR